LCPRSTASTNKSANQKLQLMLRIQQGIQHSTPPYSTRKLRGLASIRRDRPTDCCRAPFT
jgi:hypothetical protein